jgi:hypothetical protein
MRAQEFIPEDAPNDLVIKHKPTNQGHRAIETVDVDAIHAAALREHLLSNPSLYEDRDDFQAMRTFLDAHKTPKPVIKKSYVYASVQTTTVSKYASLAHFDNRHRLVDIDEQYAYFDINGLIKRFPESGKLSGDSMSQIYFFNSAAELAQFNTLLQLKFSDYKFTSKTLDHSGVEENFADGKKPGRKGLSRRVGIPKKASLSKLQKIASSSTGERRRMAQWQLNMRRGKAKKNK